MGEDEPLVSVLTSVYNRPEFLGETVRSVSQQTYPRVEHIVLDDGSDPAHAEEQRSMSEKHGAAYVWRPHRGRVFASNEMVRLSRGRYVCILDSDDVMYPTAIEKMVEEAVKHSANVIVYPHVNIIDESGNVIRLRKYPDLSQLSPTMEKAYMFRTCEVRGGRAMVPRSLWLQYPVAEKTYGPEQYAADHEHMLRLSLVAGARFKLVDHVLYGIRQHPGQSTNIPVKRKLELQWQAKADVLRLVPKEDLIRLIICYEMLHTQIP